MCITVIVVTMQAFKRGLRYPQYVYLLYGWYRHQWWHISSDNDNVTCTRSQMEQVLERSILVTQYPEILNRSQITDTGEVTCIQPALYRMDVIST